MTDTTKKASAPGRFQQLAAKRRAADAAARAAAATRQSEPQSDPTLTEDRAAVLLVRANEALKGLADRYHLLGDLAKVHDGSAREPAPRAHYHYAAFREFWDAIHARARELAEEDRVRALAVLQGATETP